MIIASTDYVSQMQSSSRISKAYGVFDGDDIVITLTSADPGVKRPCVWGVFWNYFTLAPTDGGLSIVFDAVTYWDTVIVAAGGGSVQFHGGLMSALNDDCEITLLYGTTPDQAGTLIAFYSFEDVA